MYYCTSNALYMTQTLVRHSDILHCVKYRGHNSMEGVPHLTEMRLAGHKYIFCRAKLQNKNHRNYKYIYVYKLLRLKVFVTDRITMGFLNWYSCQVCSIFIKKSKKLWKEKLTIDVVHCISSWVVYFDFAGQNTFTQLPQINTITLRPCKLTNVDSNINLMSPWWPCSHGTTEWPC